MPSDPSSRTEDAFSRLPGPPRPDVQDRPTMINVLSSVDGWMTRCYRRARGRDEATRTLLCQSCVSDRLTARDAVVPGTLQETRTVVVT